VPLPLSSGYYSKKKASSRGYRRGCVTYLLFISPHSICHPLSPFHNTTKTRRPALVRTSTLLKYSRDSGLQYQIPQKLPLKMEASKEKMSSKDTVIHHGFAQGNSGISGATTAAAPTRLPERRSSTVKVEHAHEKNRRYSSVRFGSKEYMLPIATSPSEGLRSAPRYGSKVADVHDNLRIMDDKVDTTPTTIAPSSSFGNIWRPDQSNSALKQKKEAPQELKEPWSSRYIEKSR
jgi:hypothetical protein